MFPSNIIASMFHFEKMNFFEVDEASKEVQRCTILMKRLLSFLTVLLLLMPTAVDASSTKVKQYWHYLLGIDQNGTATFVEKWDMDVSEADRRIQNIQWYE